MNDHFAKNLLRLRREHGLTQEALAAQLGLSPQSVSKWEHAQAYPDIQLFPRLAALFQVSVDSLLGYQPQKLRTTQYERRYQDETFYWGTQLWSAAFEVLRLMPLTRPMRLLDIGCGEGQAAVFFARNGYAVSAFDLAPSGLEKGRRLAEQAGVEVDFFQADMTDFRLESSFDVIYSSGALQYIPPHHRAAVLENMKTHTAPGGINILNVFVEKPFLPTPPDWEPHEFFWRSGELFSHYHDWRFERMEETIFSCDSSGVPHQHCMDVLIARRP